MSVSFSYADKKLNLVGINQIKQFVAKLFALEDKKLGDLNYVFCSDDYLLDINKEFLQHDYYTDIITFDLSEPNTETISGEIYISVDRVADNAKKVGVSFKNEVLRVIFHGALHLCGYLDKSEEEITVMRQKENYYIHMFSQ
jgi:probable rRNA maturation factor